MACAIYRFQSASGGAILIGLLQVCSPGEITLILQIFVKGFLECMDMLWYKARVSKLTENNVLQSPVVLVGR